MSKPCGTLTISTGTSGASIRNTTDGSTPTETAGTLYSGPVAVNATTTIKAIAYASGFSDSQIASATYTIQPIVATPTFTPAARTYASSLVMTISTTSAGAFIRYTTDGSTPTETTGILYGAPVLITATSTVRAIAYKSGMTDSAIASATYTISPATPNVTSVSPATSVGGATVTISGSGFGSTQGTGAVWLGSTYAASVVSWSDTQVVAIVALNSQTGRAQVKQGGTWSNSVPFTVNTATISSISPTNGLPGTTQVTINGSGFGSSQGNGQVMLGTTNGVVQNWSDSQIIALVGAGALNGNAQVLQNGVYSNAVPFVVNVPQLSSISPSSGVAGTSVTFTGSGFGSSRGSGVVTLGSANGVVQSWSDTQVIATVAATAGSGIARIQQGGYVSNAKGFMVPGGTSATLAPNLLNMVVGDTHTIQALGSNGQPITGLTWTSSDTTVVSLSTDDPPILTAVAAGHVTIMAGGASADVTVSSATLALGTVLWSNPGDGSGVTSIVPSVPSPTGIADVFAFQSDNTVAAITSDGKTAWAASFDPIIQPMPDFLGGLVGATRDLNSNGPIEFIGSVVRFDGITGQPQSLFTPPAGSVSTNTGDQLREPLRVHPDGTIFMVQDNQMVGTNGASATVSQVVGINPSGGQKFGVPLWSGCIQAEGNISVNNIVFYDSIIAGDGYYYLAYACIDTTPVASYPDGTNEFMIHRRLIRVDTSGNATDMPVADSRSAVGFFGAIGGSSLITNADQGAVFIWRPLYDGSTPQPVMMAITSGGSVAVTNGPQLPDEAGGDAVHASLQLQDGSYAGSYLDVNGNTNMAAFDTNGNVRWTVPNDTPSIAMQDGTIIGKGGTTYDQNGNAIAFALLPTYSWTENAYQIGSVDQLLTNPLLFALSFWPFQGGSQSPNRSARIPADSIANSKVKSILTPAKWRQFANSHCGAVMANPQGMAAMGIASYSLQVVQQKQNMTNYYDIGNSGIGDLTLLQVTGGQYANVTLTNYLAGANAITANLGYDRQTAIILAASILSGSNPEFTLVHEVLFHAYAGLIDNAIFGNSYFTTQQGLWRPAGSTATQYITTWLSTDCRCTPTNPASPSCTANTAKW